PIADRLGAEDLQQLQPLGLARNPRQLDHLRHQQPRTPAAGLPAGRIGTAPDRIRVTDALLYEKVVNSRTGTSRCCNRAFDSPSPNRVPPRSSRGGSAGSSAPA